MDMKRLTRLCKKMNERDIALNISLYILGELTPKNRN